MGLRMTVARGVDGAIDNVGEAIRAKNSENGFTEKEERWSACACVSWLKGEPTQQSNHFWNAANYQPVGINAWEYHEDL